MYQTGGTIKDTLESIRDKRFALPAIQREFVWRPDQICRLFDSIMQGYPFGTFLYWRVEQESADEYQFYQFMRDYHEKDHAHCDRLEDRPAGPLTAVLDGQQRLTALNIGIRGSMALKLPGKWWTNSSAFPKRKLYLNLLSGAEVDEAGARYDFAFRIEEDDTKDTGGACWFRVGKILEMKSGPEMLKWLNGRVPPENLNDAFETLDRLHRVVHSDKLVAFYEEKSQELDRVLNIFIRLNSGGTVLSYSDLLLSIATAQWSRYDAREEIHSLVDEINQIGDGFAFSKDVVLKAGLMLCDKNVGFKVENFNKANMNALENGWKEIRNSLVLTVRLLSTFGLSAASLRADSAILPIAYYLHRAGHGEPYLTSAKFAEDRDAVREWLVRSLLKSSGIWGSGLDTLLVALRSIIADHGRERFPDKHIYTDMRRRGKSLSFSQDEIDELSIMPFGDKRVFPLLSLIFPFVQTGNITHVDHVFPRAEFHKRKLEKAGLDAETVEAYQREFELLPNLQLLLGSINNEKRAKMPSVWMEGQYPSSEQRSSYRNAHLLGDVPSTIVGFGDFFANRRAALSSRIASVLKVDAS
ncbi:hypothetical protein FP2506_01095 [Fulvimarina pelagi HTCC2506]|uniref:GmrSD restriction endonucleases N-terminal domain-containing protein n=1 Tax=Fulvimarina pelagi HTCC2506 TaxID=314231 RepID=Q0G278_9HYPH|nr:DUF262 domain-containing protein [Fulvimarina pelagi]EAU41320.1 hypothetical protein FP2506_01095 [Fulvimarina pelagi HTCC2506]